MTEKKTRPANRAADTREENVRPQQWQPASLLPAPEPEDGYAFRWVRKELLGQEDPTNVSRKTREGWEPCKLEAYPEMASAVSSDARSSGLIESGGLILCKMPTEMVEQRDAYYRQASSRQIESVDNTFMKENDERMPLFNEKKSSVSFGRG